MADYFPSLTEKHIQFIQNQKLFFVGTAANEGSVNVSPKGMDSLRIIDASKVVWLNLTGSGNETAAHLLENTRMTIMFCSFDKQPLILRIYGSAKAVHPRDKQWSVLSTLFPQYTGARQYFELDVDQVQTSCGYAVPYYEMKGERSTLTKWADKRGREGVEQYWQDENVLSMDNKKTGIFEDNED
ncbi:MAG: pyridoxamine 5'-phosphate oxidase family protein [Pseudomonadales bacterium]|nr:pyridoxamine 5'-phosphate oxidase family protein [Pseudomonadales bacterium]